MRTTAIIFNKAWELEPALAAMCSPEFRPANLPFPEVLLSLKDRRPNSTYTSTDPRAVFSFHERRSNPSSGLRGENLVLPPVLSTYQPELVIAAGTAGFPMDSPVAGCVVAGSRFFVHDGHPGNSSHLPLPNYETLSPLNVNPAVLNIMGPPFKQAAEPKFIKPPNNPCPRPALLASSYYTAVSSFNVLDYGEYTWVDTQAVTAFRKVESNLPVGSIETTHALIRISSDQPCMFVSAITDSEGHFDMEVTSAQNYIAAFNAGIVLGQLIVGINDWLNANPGVSF